ncbi:hypothetical protein E2C01_060944 [Portunus trituberculatus]|uniref:Uncharacterized protein n=1 Tax=Portunus trituberculatus TaxID=210409 RepID=A0A5B7H2J7_PORTR|nr:hypothetical protein [Portunus trituberculatus]
MCQDNTWQGYTPSTTQPATNEAKEEVGWETRKEEDTVDRVECVAAPIETRVAGQLGRRE